MNQRKRIAMVFGALLLSASMFSAASVSAEEAATSGLSKEEIKKIKKEEGLKASDIDTEITNSRERARMGSKSLWSFSADLRYDGGNLSRGFGNDRPNPSKEADPTRVSLSGQLGVRYRLDKRSSMKVGTGIQILEPFHGATDKEVEDPYISYRRSYSAKGFQMASSFELDYITDKQSRDSLSKAALIDYTQSFLYPLDAIPLTLGWYTFVDFQYFDGDEDSKGNNVQARQYEWQGSLFTPFAELAFSENFSLRTVLGLARHAVNRERKFINKGVYQSIGLASVVTRDIYLYPNILFDPTETVKLDNTTLSMTAIISL